MEDRMGKIKATRKNEKSIPQASVEGPRDQGRGESESGGNERDLVVENENESGESEHEPDGNGAVRSRFLTRIRIVSF